MSDAERIAQLISALRDDNEALRDHAMACLGQMGIEAVPQLIGLMADEDVVNREAAATAVVRIGPVAFDQMLEALTDDEWAIRKQAANVLGRFRDPRAVDPLTVALKDKDGAVRTAAGWALERIGDSRASKAADSVQSDARFGNQMLLADLHYRVGGEVWGTAQGIFNHPACHGGGFDDFRRGRGMIGP